MTRRFFASIVAAMLVLIGLPATVSAHVLKVDGHIGAVLHIEPDDNPTAGSSTKYVLSFDDDTGRFSPPECSCMVSIIEDGKTVAAEKLAVSGSGVSENRYTFAKPAVYTMRFTGTPKQPGAFQPFVLNYGVRATGGRANGQQFPAMLWAGITLGIGLLLLAAYATNYGSAEPVKGRNSTVKS